MFNSKVPLFGARITIANIKGPDGKIIRNPDRQDQLLIEYATSVDKYLPAGYSPPSDNPAADDEDAPLSQYFIRGMNADALHFVYRDHPENTDVEEFERLYDEVLGKAASSTTNEDESIATEEIGVTQGQTAEIARKLQQFFAKGGRFDLLVDSKTGLVNRRFKLVPNDLA